MYYYFFFFTIIISLCLQEYKRKQLEEQRQADRLQRQLHQERAYLVSLQQQQQQQQQDSRPAEKKQLYHYKDVVNPSDKPAWAKEVGKTEIRLNLSFFPASQCYLTPGMMRKANLFFCFCFFLSWPAVTIISNKYQGTHSSPTVKSDLSKILMLITVHLTSNIFWLASHPTLLHILYRQTNCLSLETHCLWLGHSVMLQKYFPAHFSGSPAWKRLLKVQQYLMLSQQNETGQINTLVLS